MSSVGIRDFKSPGVFMRDVNSVSKARGTSPLVAAFIGIAATGPLGKAIKVNSWDEYVNIFARGLATPFMSTSYLAFSVYGFFQNGGRVAYIVRVAGASAAKATATIDALDTAVVKAKFEGEWANDMTLDVVANGSVYDFTAKIDGVVVEKIPSLSFTATDERYWVQVINDKSNFLAVTTPGVITADTDLAFSGGASDASNINDASYIGTAGVGGAIAALDDLSDFTLLAIPGQSSTTLQTAMLAYCENKGNVFAVLDSAEAAAPTAEGVIAARNVHNTPYGGLYYPWIKVYNPLSTLSSGMRNCPPSGHVCGVIARTMEKYGAWKAPAGTETVIEGAMDVVFPLTNAQLALLNPANVNCISYRQNYGLVVWGARTLTTSLSEKAMKYVSDSLLNFSVKLRVYELAQPFVFEPNNSLTRVRLATEIEALLDPMWKAGAFKGAKKEEAYFVKCDETNNTPETIAEGKLICSIGYAGTKPTEFVIFDISYDLQS